MGDGGLHNVPDCFFAAWKDLFYVKNKVTLLDFRLASHSAVRMSAAEETAVVRVQFNDEWIVRFHVSASFSSWSKLSLLTFIFQVKTLRELSQNVISHYYWGAGTSSGVQPKHVRVGSRFLWLVSVLTLCWSWFYRMEASSTIAHGISIWIVWGLEREHWSVR